MDESLIFYFSPRSGLDTVEGVEGQLPRGQDSSLLGSGHPVLALSSFNEPHTWAGEARPAFPGLFIPAARHCVWSTFRRRALQSSRSWLGKATNVGQREGTGPKSGPLRAACVQGNTSENPSNTATSMTHLSGVPCRSVPSHIIFPTVPVRTPSLGS